MTRNPNEGICVPDDLPWDQVLEVTNRFLGTCFSGPVAWDPVATRADLFAGFSDETHGVDRGDPWQFANFLTR
jgi:homospermidine synthase